MRFGRIRGSTTTPFLVVGVSTVYQTTGGCSHWLLLGILCSDVIYVASASSLCAAQDCSMSSPTQSFNFIGVLALLNLNGHSLLLAA